MSRAPEIEDIRPLGHSSGLDGDTYNGKHEAPPPVEGASRSLNGPLLSTPVVTGGMSHLVAQKYQNVKGEQSEHLSKNPFTPHQKAHIEEQIIARIDFHFDLLRAQMSKMIEEQMQQVFDGLRKSNKTGNGYRAAGFLRKILK